MKKIKKLAISLLLAVVMLVSMATPVVADPMMDWFDQMDAMIQNYRRIVQELRAELDELRNEQRVPLIHLVTPHTIMLEAGDDTEVALTVRNMGSHPAHSLLTVATVSSDAPFVVDFIGNSNRLNQLANGSQRDMNLRITVDADATPGSVGIITLTHRYNTQVGAPLETQDTILVRIGGEITVPGTANLRLTNIRASDTNLGQNGRIRFELTNTGDAVAHNILVSATPLHEGRLVPTTSNRQTVQSLGVGSTRAFEFGFMPTVNAATHSHPVQIRVEYEIRGAGADPHPFVQYVALNVYNPEPEEPEEEDEDEDEDTGRRQIPRVIVSAYTLYPQIPRAGQNFDMDITFRNTSRTRSVNNIRVVLEAPIASGQGAEGASGAVFTPVGGSNTLFIDYLAPGEEVVRSVSMFTVPDAAPRMYALEVRLDYQDEEYEVHEATELLSIPVTQFSRLETQPSEIVVAPFMDMFGFVDFEFNILNTGRVNLRNVRVRVDGNFDTHQANDYLGNLQTGRVVNFRGRIFPLEPGLQEGAIIIYAEDDAGEIVELVHPISIDVMGFENGFAADEFHGRDEGWFEGGGYMYRGDMDFGDEYVNGENGGFFSRAWGFMRRPVFWGPAAGVLVAAAVGIVILVNKKRSRLDFED